VTAYSFEVLGDPVPQGSMTAFIAGGKARVAHKAPKGLQAFRADCRNAAAQAGVTVIEGPVRLRAVFVLERPQSHRGTGKNAGMLKASAPEYHTGQRPDGDKILRSLFDALTGVCFRDDGQVCVASFVKRYVREGEAPHTSVTVDSLADEGRP